MRIVTLSRAACLAMSSVLTTGAAVGENPAARPDPVAETIPVYYDYVQDGRLRGGRLLIDPTNPRHRAKFGLEPVSEDEQTFLRNATVTTIIGNGPPENRIDIVVLGDGYTAAELGLYAAHVDNVINAFLAEQPLADYFTYFNVHRVDVISNESGVDEPDIGIFRDTALDMTYNCGGISRLLCINTNKAIAAAQAAPDVDQILALANSTRYGGAGYPSADIATLAGNNSSAVELALHEFAHAFANVADEYDYGDGATYTGAEPGDRNISTYDAVTMADLGKKWHWWLDLPHVSTYEGAGYYQFGLYRPTFNSKMRSLGRPFQEINSEELVGSMYKTIDPIDDATPPSQDPYPPGTPFFVAPLQPASHSLDVQWFVDGAPVAGATDTTFTPHYASLTPGEHTIVVEVMDNTPRVRRPALRNNHLTQGLEWTVLAEAGCPGDLDSSGDITLDDLTLLLQNFNSGPGGDLNGDGDTDLDDLTLLLGDFGTACP
jgi:hypothetical protein